MTLTKYRSIIEIDLNFTKVQQQLAHERHINLPAKANLMVIDEVTASLNHNTVRVMYQISKTPRLSQSSREQTLQEKRQ